MVDDLRRTSAADPAWPPVLLVSLASVEANRSFFAQRWPSVRVVADPDQVVFEAFGRRRGSLGQLFGPRVLARAVGALLRGHGVGRPQGDPTVMPGVFVCRGAAVLWAHRTRDVADHPDFAEVAAIARRAT